MPSTSGERDLERAKALRASLKGVASPEAKRKIKEASDRLEMRAATKLNKLGRRTKKRGSAGSKNGRLPAQLSPADIPDAKDIVVN